jgi:hypothetical protein
MTNEPLQLDHVGIIVRNAQPWIDQLSRILRVEPTTAEHVTATDAESGEMLDLTFLPAGEQRIELICPRPGGASRFSEYLDAHGEGIFHISLRTPALSEVVNDLSDSDNPIPIVLADLWSGVRANPVEEKEPTDRNVALCWIPKEMCGGINLEIIESAGPPGSAPVVPG